MATYSTLNIQNRALLLCGASPITSQTDDTPNARAINACYDDCRKEVLTEGRWSFSTTRTTLATVATTSLDWFYPEEGYLYDVPSGFLRIWEMSDLYAIWRVEGDYIISDTNALECKWTFDQTDASKFRPKFVRALIDKLASDICFMILNSTAKAKDFLEKYETISLPEAMTENSQQGVQQTVIDDAWLSSKFTNSGGDPSRSYS